MEKQINEQKIEPEKENLSLGKQEQTEKKEVEELTAEEQLALYEEHLKNSDWGHQPC